MDVIQSTRLDLIPMRTDFLRSLLSGDMAGAGHIIEAVIGEGLAACNDVFRLRLNQIEADPTFQPWSLRAMVLRAERVMVGHIGFHTAPGAGYLKPYSKTGVEFGFTVFPLFQRQGYAREAAVTLMQWAMQTHGVTEFIVSIRPDNLASQALAARLGFVRVGFHVDEVDGPEDVLLFKPSGQMLLA